MRYNKTLGVAIAAILSGGVGLAANASTLTFNLDDTPTTYTPAGTADPATSDSAINIASELVDSNGAINPAIGDTTIWFEFDRNNANIGDDVYIDFTLSGATFDRAVDSRSDLLFINANVPEVSTAPISRISGGGVDESTVRFLLQATASDIKVELGNPGLNEDRLQFTFSIGDVLGLENNGGSVKLTGAWGFAAIPSAFSYVETESEKLYGASTGVNVTFADNTSDTRIDVTQGSKKFVDGISETKALLGTISIIGANGYTIDTTNIDDNNILVIKGGPFVASTVKDDNDLFSQVFIETSGSDCVFDDGSDIAATNIEGDEATWELDSANIIAINALLTTKNICVVVPVDGETEINQTKERATAALTLDFTSGKTSTSTGRLSQMKRNGTTCTLYNVPHALASDKAFYRFSNKTDIESTVWGSIRDRDNKSYLTDQELGIVAGKSVLVVNSDELNAYAVIAGTATEGVAAWGGRAILTINSNSTDMEAYALLRAKNTKNVILKDGVATANIGPLVNVSLGASGNGCE